MPSMMSISKPHATPTNPYAHGVANLMGISVDAYFDLGGIKILINDDHYDEICGKMRNGLLPDTEMVTLHEMGFTNRGVPVDLACSTNEGSSVVWIKRWVRTTIAINTKAGRMHILTRQVVGFVRRSTPLLIVGQEGCRLCGYKNIEQQDEEQANRGLFNPPQRLQQQSELMDVPVQQKSVLPVQPSPAMMQASNLVPSQANAIAYASERDVNAQQQIIPDGNIYVGAKAHQHMEMAQYIMSDRINETIITTAVARRAGLQVGAISPRQRNAKKGGEVCPIDEYLATEDPIAQNWIKGSEEPHARE